MSQSNCSRAGLQPVEVQRALHPAKADKARALPSMNAPSCLEMLKFWHGATSVCDGWIELLIASAEPEVTSVRVRPAMSVEGSVCQPPTDRALPLQSSQVC